ncbi:MAG: protein-glutamate O-methyltransferase CheR [Chloroflexi bacterium]|nr:protein-glutamate O-methyltransferase CheR [Chloroflexota bacterium]
MTDTLLDQQLSELSDFVASTMGLYFPRERWSDLERQAKLAAREFGHPDVESFLEWLLTSPLSREQVEMLASYLTISETYFWREPHVFEALRDQILPELIRLREGNGRHLRLWSAGCATGEEPYSMAIALQQALPAWKDWHITLLATDINPVILRRAAGGIYGEWSFRNSPAWFKDRYFTPLPRDKYEIKAEIRKMVTFAYLNLASDAFPAPMNETNAMDILFCRNVLMYFSPTRSRLVGQRLYHCLVDGGWFILSSSELSQHMFPQFASINFPGAIVYRRETGKSRPAEAFRVGEPAPAAKKPLHSPLKTAVMAAPVVTALKPSQPISVPRRTVTEARSQEIPPVEAIRAIRRLADQGRLGEAWAACEAAMAADKLDPGLLYLGATILQELDREEEAATALKRLLYLNPNYLLAHFALGNLAQRRGNAAAAGKSFKNVLALLEDYEPADILPEADGLTAGRFSEIVRATLQMGANNDG